MAFDSSFVNVLGMNELQEIKGIGTSTANILLKTFRSVNNVKQQPLTELSRVIGPSKAKIVKAYFDRTEEEQQAEQ